MILTTQTFHSRISKVVMRVTKILLPILPNPSKQTQPLTKTTHNPVPTLKKLSKMKEPNTHSNASSSSLRTTTRKIGKDLTQYSFQITTNSKLIRIAAKFQVYRVTCNYLHKNMSVWSEHLCYICFYELPFKLGLFFPIAQVFQTFLSHFNLAPS